MLSAGGLGGGGDGGSMKLPGSAAVGALSSAPPPPPPSSSVPSPASVFTSVGTTAYLPSSVPVAQQQPAQQKHQLGQLRADLLGLLDDPATADVTIVVGEDLVEFKAHRLILKARSEYFRDLYSDGRAAVAAQSSVDLTLLDPDAFRIVLRYFYTGEENDEATDPKSEDWRLVLAAFRACTFLGVPDRSAAYRECYTSMFARFSTPPRSDRETCRDMWVSADELELNDLMVGCAAHFWRLFGAQDQYQQHNQHAGGLSSAVGGFLSIPMPSSHSALSSSPRTDPLAPSSQQLTRFEVSQLLGARLDCLVKVLNAIPPELESPIGKFRIVRSWAMTHPPPPTADGGDGGEEEEDDIMPEPPSTPRMRRTSAGPPLSPTMSTAASDEVPYEMAGVSPPRADRRRRRASRISSVSSGSGGGLVRRALTERSAVSSGSRAGAAGRNAGGAVPTPVGAASRGLDMRARQQLIAQLDLAGISAADLVAEVEPSGLVAERQLLALYRAAALDRELAAAARLPPWLPVPTGFPGRRGLLSRDLRSGWAMLTAQVGPSQPPPQPLPGGEVGLGLGMQSPITAAAAVATPAHNAANLRQQHADVAGGVVSHSITYCMVEPLTSGRYTWTVIPLRGVDGIGIGVSADVAASGAAAAPASGGLSPWLSAATGAASVAVPPLSLPALLNPGSAGGGGGGGGLLSRRGSLKTGGLFRAASPTTPATAPADDEPQGSSPPWRSPVAAAVAAGVRRLSIRGLMPRPTLPKTPPPPSATPPPPPLPSATSAADAHSSGQFLTVPGSAAPPLPPPRASSPGDVIAGRGSDSTGGDGVSRRGSLQQRLPQLRSPSQPPPTTARRFSLDDDDDDDVGGRGGATGGTDAAGGGGVRLVGDDGGWAAWADGSLRVGRIFVGRLRPGGGGGGGVSGSAPGPGFVRGTAVTVRVDVEARTVAFEVDGADCGVAFRNVGGGETGGALYASVTMPDGAAVLVSRVVRG